MAIGRNELITVTKPGTVTPAANYDAFLPHPLPFRASL